MAKIVVKVAFGLLVWLVVGCNGRLYTPVPDPADGKGLWQVMAPSLFHLRAELDNGSAETMQQLFPEGYFFSYTLYGLSWLDLGTRFTEGEPERIWAVAEAKWALAQIESSAGQAAFAGVAEPPLGMFYQAWRAYLLAGIVEIDGSAESSAFTAYDTACAQLAHALQAADEPFLPSYPEQVWPVDTLPAMAALARYSRIADDRYAPLVATWLEQSAPYLDSEYGLLPHRLAPFEEMPRATSQVMILRFLAEIDAETAAEQYAIFRSQYVTSRFGLPAVREYPKGIRRTGDVDSGPLISGISLSATAIAMSTARANGDESLASALWQAGEALGLPYRWHSERIYGLGVLPIGQAFVTWSHGAQAASTTASVPTVPSWWRLPFHFISMFSISILWLFVRKIGRSSPQAAPK